MSKESWHRHRVNLPTDTGPPTDRPWEIVPTSSISLLASSVSQKVGYISLRRQASEFELPRIRMHSNHRKNSIWWIATFGVMLSSLTYSISGCKAFDIAPMASIAWSWYKNALVTKPLFTKSITSSCVMAFSDIMCQELVSSSQGSSNDEKGQSVFPHSSAGLDYSRILHVAVTGALWSGPITHFWYAALEKIYGAIAQFFRIHDPAVGLIVKLFLDGIIFSPVTITGYFTMRSILEGTGLNGTREKLTSRFRTTLVGAWKFWPLANAFNFWYVPYQFRVLYMNILALFWTGYLTYVNSKKVNVAAP
jgi:hypothetical protein